MAQTLSNVHLEEEAPDKETVIAQSPVPSPSHDPPPASSRTLISPVDAESYYNSIRSSRTNSIYSLSRISFSNQFQQLASLHLPEPSWLSTSISNLPNAAAAASALNVAAEEIRKWLKKATEVLYGLDAEDDVDWAAAGGREGLGEVDAAVGKFETLITSYVVAIENLQGREDVLTISTELNVLVQQMEKTLGEWEKVRQLLRGIKSQVELAMEWEELWNHVLGDIGLEVENLGRLIFEMEEARHRAMAVDPKLEDSASIDVQELETIIEDAPTRDGDKSSRRFTLLSVFSAVSPTSPVLAAPQEDSRLLALFARMQPLRASLDFLPMTLSSFRTRAVTVLPTACQELDDRRKVLEKKWKALERDAESLRRELGEDRWVLVFRNAGRQAQKLIESVERSISRLQESIDLGTQHSNPPVLAKKIESYEAKKVHYGPAIERVLAIIDKGAKDRVTVNGEILRLQQDTRSRWKAIEAEIKDMDMALDDLATNKNQQLRDSISTIVSMDRSATGSAVDTPRSSPASSPIFEPTSTTKGDPLHAVMSRSSRRSSVVSNSTSRPASSRRYASMPHGLASQLSRKNSGSGSISDSRNASPSRSKSSSTPIPGTRSARPALSQNDHKPRWNSSPKVDHTDFSRNPKPSPLPASTPNRKSSMTFRTTPHSAPSRSTNPPLPSPLGRSFSPAPSNSVPRARHTSNTHSSLGTRQSSFPSPTSASRPKPTSQASTPQLSSPASRRPSIPSQTTLPEDAPEQSNSSPSARPRLQRPLTALASRRVSMLPVPKSLIESGRESPMTAKMGSSGRESSLGIAPRKVSSGRESAVDGERRWK